MIVKKSSIVVVLLLVLFPLISWLYLKNGISFRKNALTELSNKEAFDFSILKELSIDDYKEKIVLIDIEGKSDNTQNIYNQFKESNDFKIISSDKRYQLEISNETLEILKTEYNNAYLLIDNEGYLRNKYENTDTDMKKAVVHIATLIPFVEKKKPRGIK